MFNVENAKRRAAELGQLLGPILVRGCGPGGVEGEVYFKALTVGEDTRVKRLRESSVSTFRYQELILRAKDKNGDRIWDDDELDDVLSGGIDPMDCAYIIGSMYAGDKYKREAEGEKGPFCKEAARESFESVEGMYGPVQLPHLGDDGGDLDIYYKHGNGYLDCAIGELRRKYPHEFELRYILKKALTRSGEPMFKSTHLAHIAAALEPADLDKAMIAMQSPKFMSDEERIRLSVASSLDPDPSVEELKN